MRRLVLLLMAALPLQWFVVAGPLRLHLVAMLLFGLAAAFSYRGRAFVPVLRVAAPFFVANAALCVIWIAINLYHELPLRQPIQQLIYLAIAAAVGTVVYRGLTHPATRIVEVLRWSALVTTVSFLAALTFSMAVNGTNAATVFAQTIIQANPDILQQELFRSAFAGFGFDEESVRSNFRHEVFGALLFSMCLASAAQLLRPFASPAARNVYRFSIALGALLLILSISRSVLIAAALWPLLALLRSLLAARLSPRVVGAGLVGVGILAVLWAVGVVDLLYVRFAEDTGSYQSRDRLLEAAFQNIVANGLTGGVATTGESSHNFVLDTWLRTGVFGAAAAFVVTVLVIGLLARLSFNLHREPDWMLPVTAVLLLPIVRMFTAGGGLIPPVSWVALGAVAGFMAYRSTLTRQPGSPAPAGATALSPQDVTGPARG